MRGCPGFKRELSSDALLSSGIRDIDACSASSERMSSLLFRLAMMSC